MKLLSIVFGIIGLVSGLIAARYWFASTQAKIDPDAQASKFNATAALWTALADIGRHFHHLGSNFKLTALPADALPAFVSDALRINNEAFSSRPRPYSG
jgi:hypothetical protein